jgi:NADPH:quinone reductase-like Zn-dependent oxidoreductase
MSTKATAASIYEYGEPDVFRFETMDVPDPVGHEVLVRNTVIGLNFVDIYYRRGTHCRSLSFQRSSVTKHPESSKRLART